MSVILDLFQTKVCHLRKVLLARDFLAALTTTCRISCEPAMDMLWATVILCELPPLERSECVEIIYPQH
ncbi:hypothetical protein C8R48DRAFT_41413 [Suillus tomentosus]|nr:hypothetical protein C8R48DRAFT_41413 [Suillus tomentosus]